ncbi:hypothetical protein AJ78_08912 [Emergomyces pasteurianus Ep9510]|uniref:Uncharacterized protein n=1 Tax=Emergomyces pasteurianus Ep9510 TaxID=1447872 RepID=A0A1J9Q0L8_9EURO|nr:hypothetical protein AJ78_08912 [Emergomyces pasteurianus Ep9510]
MARPKRSRGRRARAHPSSSGSSHVFSLSMSSLSSASSFISNDFLHSVLIAALRRASGLLWILLCQMQVEPDVLHTEPTAAQSALMIMLLSVNLNTLAADALAAKALCSVPPARSVDPFFYDHEGFDQGLSGSRSRDKRKTPLCDLFSPPAHATRSKCKAVKSPTLSEEESHENDGNDNVISEEAAEDDYNEIIKIVNVSAAGAALDSEDVFDTVIFFSSS